MSGGVVYIFDEIGDFVICCNFVMVGLEKLEDFEEIKDFKELIQNYVNYIDSVKGKVVLVDWEVSIFKFVKVMFWDYKWVL